PGAPEDVSRMAAVIAAAERGPDTAIAFLMQLQEETPNKEMRAALRERIRELVLMRDIDALEAAVRTFVARFARQPATFGELVAAGIVTATPTEPFGGYYVLEPATGRVSSSTGHAPRRLQHSKIREQFLSKTPPGG